MKGDFQSPHCHIVSQQIAHTKRYTLSSTCKLSLLILLATGISENGALSIENMVSTMGSFFLFCVKQLSGLEHLLRSKSYWIWGTFFVTVFRIMLCGPFLILHSAALASYSHIWRDMRNVVKTKILPPLSFYLSVCLMHGRNRHSMALQMLLGSSSQHQSTWSMTRSNSSWNAAISSRPQISCP